MRRNDTPARQEGARAARAGLAQDLAQDYVTVAEAAQLLRVSPSTLWRWIDEGKVPAYRVGHRRIWLKRADLARLIAPARELSKEASFMATRRSPPLRRMTTKEQRQALAAVEAARRLQAKLLEARGGELFHPSWLDIDEARAERSHDLG